LRQADPQSRRSYRLYSIEKLKRRAGTKKKAVELIIIIKSEVKLTASVV
jgi:hypothetical protein